QCVEPPAIDNGMHNGTKGTSFVQGSAVVYQCKDGFTLAGAATLHCEADNLLRGVWSNPAPECRATQCPLPRIQNGKREHITRYSYRPGDTVSFVCNTGYMLQGSRTSMCRADFRWSPPLPVCKKGKFRPCPMPPKVHNGNHDGQGTGFFTMGTPVTYTCDPGYYLVGNPVVTCRASGNWSQP
ncbi:Complement receptor type 2, partial [Phalacrocorax carbo]